MRRRTIFMVAGCAFASACTSNVTAETHCYRNGELAFIQEIKSSAKAGPFGAATATSSSKMKYVADWYDPALHGAEITCTTTTAVN